LGSKEGPLGEERCSRRESTRYSLPAFSAIRLMGEAGAVGLRRLGYSLVMGLALLRQNNLFLPWPFMGILMAGGIFTGANPTT